MRLVAPSQYLSLVYTLCNAFETDSSLESMDQEADLVFPRSERQDCLEAQHGPFWLA